LNYKDDVPHGWPPRAPWPGPERWQPLSSLEEEFWPNRLTPLLAGAVQEAGLAPAEMAKELARVYGEGD
jgi:hypothetical protein